MIKIIILFLGAFCCWHDWAVAGQHPSLLAALLQIVSYPFVLAVIFLHAVILGRQSDFRFDQSVGVYLALAYWLFPRNRVRRWMGTYDPFKNQDMPHPLPLVWLVDAADFFNKFLFGRQKTGGWASGLELFANPFRRGNILIGRVSLFGFFGLLRAVSLKPTTTIAMVFGRPGSGKSTTAAINNAIMHDGPLVVFDTKGEICQRSHGARLKHGDVVHVVDPLNLTKLPRARYNPLHEIGQEKDPDKAIRLIFNLCEGLVKNPGGENAWVYDGARDLATGFVAYVITSFPPKQRTLATMRRLLVEGNRDRYAQEMARDKEKAARLSPFEAQLANMLEAPPGPFRHLIAGAAATLRKMGDRQSGSIIAALIEATKWLDLPQYVEATSDCDFLLSSFETQQISLFICVPLNELTGVAAGFVRFFLTTFTDMMFRAAAPPKAGKVALIVDEWPQYGMIPRFSAIGPTMRSYGLSPILLIAQDLQQVRTTYPNTWESILGCAEFIQYMGLTHGETIDYLVKSLGEKLIREKTPDGRMITRACPLLDREQAARFLDPRCGNQIIWRGSRRPMRLKTAPFYWYLPIDRYSADPSYPEPKIKAWVRRRAARQTAATGSSLRRWPRWATTFAPMLFLAFLAFVSGGCSKQEPMPDTPLIVAIKEHDIRAVKIEADKLLEHDLDPKHLQRKAAMHVAIDCWFVDAAMELIHHGASPNDALDYSRATGRREIHNNIARMMHDPKGAPLM